MNAPAALDPADIGLALARPLFRAGIALAATDPRATHHRARPEESAFVGRMALSRQQSFAAGRAALRRAMANLGAPPCPVPVGSDRAPLWPAGLTGSLSHSQTCCVAVLARTQTARALGIDVEEDTPLAHDLRDIVCTDTEQAWLASLPAADAGGMAKLIFSAKECAYKCQYTLSRTLFGFETFEVRPVPETGRFEATFTRAVAPFSKGTRLSGRFARAGGLIVTAMTLDA